MIEAEWYYPTGASGPVACAWDVWVDGVYVYTVRLYGGE